LLDLSWVEKSKEDIMPLIFADHPQCGQVMKQCYTVRAKIHVLLSRGGQRNGLEL